jgi:hypothetical protein
VLRPTKGMGHPTPPPSLARCALGVSERRRLRGDGSTGPMINFAELDAQNSARDGLYLRRSGEIP